MSDLALQVGLSIFLHGTVVLAAAGLIVRYGPALPAATRHATWMAAFGVLLLLPLGQLWMPGWTVDLSLGAGESRSVGTFSARSPSVLREGVPGGLLGASGGEEGRETGAVPRSGSAGSVGWGYWPSLYRRAAEWAAPGFLLLWGGGVLLLVGRFGVGMWTLRRWTRAARSLDCGGLPKRLAQTLNLRRSFSVRWSSGVDGPVVWGVWNPVVLLPKAATDWSQDRMRSVLLHELAHLKRGDGLTHPLGRIVRACFWPNPLVWWAVEAATDAQEQACDDVVLRSGVAPWAYAEQLLEVMKTLRRDAAVPDAVALDAGRRFKTRMRALLGSATSRRAVTLREAGVLLLAGVGILAVLSAFRVRSAEEQGHQYRLEAERAVLPSAFAPGRDAETSTEYIHVPERAPTLDRPPRSEPLEYTFATERAGPHVVWARVRVPSNDHNSFWLRVDDTRWIRWNGIEPGERWHWVQVRDADRAGRPVTFDLSEGEHRLQVRHREAGIEVDQFVVTDDPNHHPRIGAALSAPDDDAQVWLEAEAEATAPFRVEHAPHASRWRHVAARPDAEALDAPPTSGHMVYSFTAARRGTYHLWGRVIAPDDGSNSLWIRVDDGPWIRWNDIRRSEGWIWDRVHDADDRKAPVQFDLAAGPHRLTVAVRERGVRLDRLMLTPDATYRPRGTGARPEAPPSVVRTLSSAAARLTAPMVRRSNAPDEGPPGLGVPDGEGNDAPAGGPGAAEWTFSVPEDGAYVVWGEIAASATNDNSFYVSVDGEEEIAWHTPAPGETSDGWVWDPVSRYDGDTHVDPVVFSLDAGRHRLRVRNREDGTRLRRLRVTNVSRAAPAFVQP